MRGESNDVRLLMFLISAFRFELARGEYVVDGQGRLPMSKGTCWRLFVNLQRYNRLNFFVNLMLNTENSDG